MPKREILVGVLGLLLVVSVGTASCSSSTSKKAMPSADAGAAGEPSVSGAGAGARAGSAGMGAGAGAPAGGSAGESDVAAGAGGLAGGSAGSASAGEGGAGGAPTSALQLVYNTGVDDSGAVLAGGSVDPHYTLLQSPDTMFTGPDAIVTTDIAEGYWLPQSDTSKWIAPSANQSYPGATPCNEQGTYVWRTTFTLTAEQAASIQLTGGWAADNSGPDVRLNGVSLGLATPSYSPLTAFTIDSGFIAGKNTLDFEVADVGCPNGLRVELSASDKTGT